MHRKFEELLSQIDEKIIPVLKIKLKEAYYSIYASNIENSNLIKSKIKEVESKIDHWKRSLFTEM